MKKIFLLTLIFLLLGGACRMSNSSSSSLPSNPPPSTPSAQFRIYSPANKDHVFLTESDFKSFNLKNTKFTLTTSSQNLIRSRTITVREPVVFELNNEILFKGQLGLITENSCAPNCVQGIFASFNTDGDQDLLELIFNPSSEKQHIIEALQKIDKFFNTRK